ncbi:hypothetical protein N7466_009079 [Penicillium verhagenii]|uniref:uncharacterized protein n=1 Tax=Penicillium verhagenii TaxID=1562060 RepID=UPI002544F696|nr:uncharacterized protein N7466_009079 [Penicillium verhagenii]KAJ5924892.1 hypothetical protein N7466_009079 [Penicillium verhagenii]
MLRRISTQFKRNKDGNGDTEPKAEKQNKRFSKVSPTRKSSAKEEPAEVHQVKRAEVVAVFEKYAQAIHASREPLPNQTGDGTYLKHDQSSGLIDDIKTLGFRDVNTVKDLIANKASGELIDDKTYLMERIIQLVADLPGHSPRRVELTNTFLDELWTSLPHPPLSYMGDDYKYRTADGSNNNPTLPWLGAANTPYCRTIPPLAIQPSGLPDAGLVFDSFMFFNWASLVIHDRLPSTTPEQDLRLPRSLYSYGDVKEQQDQIRSHKDGKLKPDCFSEGRLQALPPACGVLLVMLNRFHNHVVEQLAEDDLEKAWVEYDEDLFQTGRLITCGLYINITLYDYLRTIVNLNRTNSTWFNLAYRWHSAIAAGDEKWIDQVYFDLMGKPADQVTMPELLMGMKKVENMLDADPSKQDGKFNDEELVAILKSATEDVAGSFGPRNVHKALRSIEILGMEAARRWQVGSLNKFRKHFGLKTYDLSRRSTLPRDRQHSRHLYEHPDFVELYPGIVSEEAEKPMVPGVGIAPTYTVSRAVLSDAVALVRGDRHYTIDYNPRNLTNWGYNKTSAVSRITLWDTPAFTPSRINLTSHESAKLVMGNQADFEPSFSTALQELFGKGEFDTKQQQALSQALSKEEFPKLIKQFYEETTLHLIQQNGAKLANINQVDITRDTEENPAGLFTEHEMYMILTTIFAAPLRCRCPQVVLSAACRHRRCRAARCLVSSTVEADSDTGLLSGLMNNFTPHDNALREFGTAALRNLQESGLTSSEITWSQIIPTLRGRQEALGQDHSSRQGGFRRGRRAALPLLPGGHPYQRNLSDACAKAQTPFTVEDNGKTVRSCPATWSSLPSSRPTTMPAPSRPEKSSSTVPSTPYITHGRGPNTGFGQEITKIALVAMLRVVGRLENLRRARGGGPAEKIKQDGGYYVYLRQDGTSYFPFPMTPLGRRLQFEQKKN